MRKRLVVMVGFVSIVVAGCSGGVGADGGVPAGDAASGSDGAAPGDAASGSDGAAPGDGGMDVAALAGAYPGEVTSSLGGPGSGPTAPATVELVVAGPSALAWSNFRAFADEWFGESHECHALELVADGTGVYRQSGEALCRPPGAPDDFMSATQAFAEGELTFDGAGGLTFTVVDTPLGDGMRAPVSQYFRFEGMRAP